MQIHSVLSLELRRCFGTAFRKPGVTALCCLESLMVIRKMFPGPSYSMHLSDFCLRVREAC
jgi:hypothetical protein